METFAHCGEVQISMKKDEFLFIKIVIINDKKMSKD